MKKIIDYQVVEASETTSSIGRLVMDAILDGFQPFGSLVVFVYNGECYYAQAMVRYEEA